MPANLTPEFLKARTEFRAAQTPQEKLAALEKMLTTIPKHKGTDKMQGDIKRRIAKLRDSQSHTKQSKGPRLDHIDREGAGQVVLLGPPNSGKSSLLSALTNARPEIADYPYSTVRPMPGMMAFEDVPIQLIDLPPITAEYSEPWVYSLIRQCNLCLIVLDGTLAPEELVDIVEELIMLVEERHIRLVARDARSEEERIKEICCRIILTKGDQLSDHSPALAELAPLFPALFTSTETGAGLDELRQEVFTVLNLLRIYTKLPGKPPDMGEPYVLSVGSTALDAVKAVHREFVDKLRYIRVWGSGRFAGQQVPATHRLADKDIIEIHLS